MTARTRRGDRGPRRRTFKTSPLSKYEFSRGPYAGMTDRDIGVAECETVVVNLPFSKRLLEEVRQYNQRYGIASWADIVEEWNSRCKDPEFQGKEYRYAYTDIDKIYNGLEELVRQGRLKHVKNDLGPDGYEIVK